MVRRIRLGPALVASTLLCAAVARAEESPPLTEELFLGDMPQVLTATRLRQPLSETPAAVTVIDQRVIRASGATTIPDILRLVPGMQVGHLDGHASVVTYHGLSDVYARRLQVLIDGRSVYTPAFGGVQWEALPVALEDIDRIEVTRGPNGVTYGANAFSATVNVITRDPAQDQGLSAKATRGSIGTSDSLIRHGGTTGDLRYRTTLGYHRDAGFENTVDDKRVSLFTFRSDYRASNRDSVESQFGYQGGTYGDGTENDRVDPSREKDVDSAFGQMRWKHIVNAENEYQLLFYHNYYRSSDTYRTALLSQVYNVSPATIVATFGRPDQQFNVIEDLHTQRSDLEFQHTLTFGADLRFVWGTEARLDRVRGQGWFNTADWIDNKLFRLFSDVEWHAQPDWIVNTGAMYEHNDITGGDVSPRIALNYRMSPGQTLRTGASRAYRTPSAFEAYADTAYRFGDGAALDQLYRGSDRLQPEEITSYELGYIGQFYDPQVLVDLRLFHDTIRKIIAEYRDVTTSELSTSPNGSKSFSNDGNAEVGGAEMQLTWSPTVRTQLIYSYAYTRQHGRLVRTSPNQYGNTEYGTTESSTPLHTRSLMAMHRFTNGIETSVAYYKVGQFRFLESSGHSGDYNTVDARLAYRARLGRDAMELALVGQNLTGDYYDYNSRNVFDKRYFFTLGMELR